MENPHQSHQFSCCATEGSHHRLQYILRNNRGLSLLCGHLRVYVVVDNHTIDDDFWQKGWDVTKRSMCGQGLLTVWLLASPARNKALSDLNYVNVSVQRFGMGKWQP